jgi:hypothetical protein
MHRLMVGLLVIVVVSLTGCRHSSCGTASRGLFHRGENATPVSYPAASGPVMSYPASFGSPVTGVPPVPMVLPGSMDGATELPFPNPAIPPTSLPTNPVSVNPGAARSASLPK